MAGYIGKSQGVTLLNVESNTVETADIQDGAVTAAKLDQTYLTPTGDGSQLTGIEALPDAIDVNASAPADSLAIDSSGNVGIGTDSPRASLDFGVPTLSSTLSSTLSDYQVMLEAPSGTGNYAHNIGWAESTGLSVTVAAINALDEGGSGATSLTFVTGNNSSIVERMRIDSSGRVTKPYQPSFAAYVTTHTATFSNTVITFDGTQHNNGSHYNTSNGRFTAPVNGYYFFAYNVQKSGSSAIEVQFQKNGAKQQDSYVSKTDDGGAMHTANSVVWYLSSGDYVDVKCTSGTAYGDYTHFTGHLLS